MVLVIFKIWFFSEYFILKLIPFLILCSCISFFFPFTMTFISQTPFSWNVKCIHHPAKGKKNLVLIKLERGCVNDPCFGSKLGEPGLLLYPLAKVDVMDPKEF